MQSSILREKSFSFALEIVRQVQVLHEYKEYVLSKQLMQSGTAVGALLWEAEFAQSKAAFINKLNVALKEANETQYWLLLLQAGKYINGQRASSLISQCKELISMLVSSLKTLKGL